MSEEKSKKSNSDSEQSQAKKKRKYSKNQYELLKSCSKKKDIKEWNEWRKKNPEKDVNLEGAKLCNFYLKKALFNTGYKQYLTDVLDKQVHFVGKVYLERADFRCSHLEGADFSNANLIATNFDSAHLKSAYFVGARLEHANLVHAELEDTDFFYAQLKAADFRYTNLEGAKFDRAYLEGAYFDMAVVDGKTSFLECNIDRNTYFRYVALDSVRIEPGTKQLLKYTLRRENWEAFYERHFGLGLLLSRFWAMSDYGLSTIAVIKSFFKWALIFAIIYYIWGALDYYLLDIKNYPGIVSNLFTLEHEPKMTVSRLVGHGLIEQQKTEPIQISGWLVPFRAVYFSIVTMTTLGFGDMYANTHSFLRGLFGHILLGIQVILGYVLLGALVTRLNILFTAGGPAGDFPKKNKEK